MARLVDRENYIMKIIKVKNSEEMSEEALKIVLEVVKNKSDAVLGLATGSTPIGLYKKIIEEHKNNGTSYAECRAVNLDEYVGLDVSSNQSYVYFMRDNLFNHIDIKLENTHIPNGKSSDKEAECQRYNELLKILQQDIQILGIGSNGHIAFNEPETPFDSVTHIVDLAESTIKDNSRLFNSIDEVPCQAFTMGLSNIMNAKKILILANGESKANAIRELVLGEIREEIPATILRNHTDCVLICDEAAGKYI